LRNVRGWHALAVKPSNQPLTSQPDDTFMFPGMRRAQFQPLRGRHQWANARLYAAVLDLSEPSYLLHIGVFFGNLHGTLNHPLLADASG
jgi:hypothetical protein